MENIGLILAAAGLTTAALGVKKGKKDALHKRAVPDPKTPEVLPDLPEVMKEIQAPPTVINPIVPVVKPIIKDLAIEKILKPILAQKKVEEIAYELSDEDIKLFPEFAMMEQGNLQRPDKTKGYYGVKGISVAQYYGNINYTERRLKILATEIAKIKKNGLGPLLKEEYKQWYYTIRDIIAEVKDDKVEAWKYSRANAPDYGGQSPSVSFVGVFAEIEAKIKFEQRRLRTLFSTKYQAYDMEYAKQYAAYLKENSGVSILYKDDRTKKYAEQKLLRDKWNKWKTDNPAPPTEERYHKGYNDWINKRAEILAAARASKDYKAYSAFNAENKAPYIYASDYNEGSFNFIGQIVSWMRNLSVPFMNPWADPYDGTTTQSKGYIQSAKNNLSNNKIKLEKMIIELSGSVTPEDKIAELQKEVDVLKKGIANGLKVKKSYNELVAKNWHKKKYIKYIKTAKTDYNAEIDKEIEIEINETCDLYFENQIQSAKVLDGTSLDAKARRSYQILSNFYLFKAHALRKIRDHVSKMKYTEIGKFKRSALIKEGFKGYEEVPYNFVQWANLEFKSGFMGSAVIAMTEMYQELMGYNDPIRQFEFYKEVKPLLADFDKIFKTVKATLTHPNQTLTTYTTYSYAKEVKLIAKKINDVARRKGANVFALLDKYIPDSWYEWSNKTKGKYVYTYTGLKIPQNTIKKMKTIIKAKEDEFLKVYPDSDLDFSKIRNRAYYFKDIEVMKDDLISYFPKRIIELKKEIVKVKQQMLGLVEESIQYTELEKMVNGLSYRRDIVIEMKMKGVVLPIVNEVEKFFYDKEQIIINKKNHQKYLDDVKSTLIFLKQTINSDEADPEDKVKAEENLKFWESEVLDLVTESLTYKNKVYEFILGMGLQMVQEKQFQDAKVHFDEQLKAGKYPYKKGSFSFPRPPDQPYNPSVDYDKKLTGADAIKYMSAERTPISKEDVQYIMMGFQGFPISTDVYIDYYTKIAGHLKQIMKEKKSRHLDPYQDKEWIFFSFLYYKLMAEVPVKYDIRALLPVEAYGSSFKTGRWGQGGTFLEIKVADVKKKMVRVEAIRGGMNHNENFMFDKILTHTGGKIAVDADFTNKNIFSADELWIIQYSIINPPDVEYVMNYSDKNDLLPVDAMKELDLIWQAFMRYRNRRTVENRDLGHDNYRHASPMFVNMNRKWNNLKYTVAKAQKDTATAVVKELINYLTHWEKHENDTGWNGAYAWMFKSNAERFVIAGLYQDHDDTASALGSLPNLFPLSDQPTYKEYLDGMGDLPPLEYDETMGGFLDFVKKAIEVVKSPAEKAWDKAKSAADSVGNVAKKVTSPITGVAKEILTDLEESKLKKMMDEAYDSTIKKHIMERLGNAMSKVEKFALRPAGKLFKKVGYQIVPKSFFTALKAFSKMPEHMLKHGIDKDSMKTAMRQLLVIGTGINVHERLVMNAQGKLLGKGIADVHVIGKLDLYTGGLLTSGSNLAVMQEDIAKGKKVDRMYVLMRTVDAVKVGGAIVAGPIMVAAQAGAGFLINETELGETSVGRVAVRTAAAGIAIYATGGADVLAKEGARAGATEAGKKGGTITLTAATNIAIQREAKATAVREIEKNAARHTFLGDTDIGRTALGLGLAATANAIYDESSVTAAVQKAAEAEATRVAKGRADEQLQKIDKNLTVDGLISIYKLKDKNLKQIIKDAVTKFEEDVKSGRLLDKAKKEADRFIKREINEKFQKELSKYSNKFLDYLMYKYGPKWNYDYDIVPQDYILYQDWIYYYQEQQDPRVFNITYVSSKKKAAKKAAIIGSGVLAAGLVAWFALEE